MTSAERIGVYHGMYLMRMEEALETDYPVIRYHLGDHQFAYLVREYVQRNPSTSYTLNRLGDHLPQFFLDEPEWHEAAFLHDLARLELTRAEYDLLHAIVGGAALAEALATAAVSNSPRQQAKVYRWFRTWISEGLFTAIES